MIDISGHKFIDLEGRMYHTDDNVSFIDVSHQMQEIWVDQHRC